MEICRRSGRIHDHVHRDVADDRQGRPQTTACCYQYVIKPMSRYGYELTRQAEATAVETLQNQFSGYGSTSTVVARCLDRLKLAEPLQHWSDETILRVVEAFIDEKFPTVIALNKIDHADADKVKPSLYTSRDMLLGLLLKCLRRTSRKLQRYRSLKHWF